MKNNTPMPRQSFPPWLLSTLIVTALCLSFLALYTYSSTSSATVIPSHLKTQYKNILNQSDAINTHWMRTLNPMMKNIQGSILWSSSQQQGMMQFQGLPKSKNNQHYRLWIYDLENKAGARISSALFKNSHNAPSKLLVPIQPQFHISTPFKFELVLEEENSSKEALLLLAQP